MSSTVMVGARAEDQACEELELRGYVIVERNYRCIIGELDIIARHRGCLVFVEVRSRAGDGRGHAEETVDRHKRRRLERVAAHYLAERDPEFEECRFDVVGITGGRLRLIEDAFRMGD